MGLKKTASTHELAQIYGTSGDNIIRDLAKAGLQPKRTVTLGDRIYRKWDRQMAVQRLDEIREQRQAAKKVREQAKPAEPAPELRGSVNALIEQVALLVAANAELTKQVADSVAKIDEVQSTLASFMQAE